MSKIKIAIIGCGAASVAFIRSLIDESKFNNFNHYKLTIFEPALDLGVGLAYQDDLSNLIINRPLQTSSVHCSNLNEFYYWLKEKPNILKNMVVESNEHDDQRSYISRKIFGHYLKDIFEMTLSEASSCNIEVEIVRKKVTKIHSINPFIIEAAKKEIFITNYVVLCTGNNEPADIYGLVDTPRYINSPYPLELRVQPIDFKQNIGIIGNSLTAIDIAISLYILGHTGIINMLSRRHVHPRVRGKISDHNLEFFTLNSIIATKIQKGKFSLRDALRLLRKELQKIGFSWKPLLVENDKQKHLTQILKEEIEAAKTERKWQTLLSSTNQLIEECWYALDNKSKSIFMKYYQRIWINNRSPIPLKNAEILLEMAENNLLYSTAGLQDIKYINKLDKYTASSKSGQQLEFDWIINATGPSRHIEPKNTLLYNLIEDGYGRENSFGGLEVDFETSSLLNKAGEINPHIRAIGHNTIGVHFYTSSLEMIAKRAKKISKNLIEFMIKEALDG